MPRLKEIRESKGITQQQLADLIGCHIRYIAFLESGDRTPSLKVAYKLASVLNTSIDNIFLPSKCTKCTVENK